MARDEDYVTFKDVRAKAATDKAVLCVIDDEEYWIPKNQIHEDSEVYGDGHEGTLIISEWIATEKGLT